MNRPYADKTDINLLECAAIQSNIVHLSEIADVEDRDITDLHELCLELLKRGYELSWKVKLSVDYPTDEAEICNECGRPVHPGSGNFINRVRDLDTFEERVSAGKPYPRGGYTCAECEAAINKE